MTKVYLLLSLLLSLSAFAKKPSIKITVPITASSFQVEAKKIYGSIKKNGDSYSAKEIYVKVKHLKSGMDLRDDHMKNKERLNAKKHKKIYVRNIKASAGTGNAWIFIKGKKKKIKFSYKVKSGQMIAKFNFKVAGFGLKKLSYMGIGVKENEGLDVVARIPIK
jgi:polyisoprenoid-binding protein YceI